MNERLFIGVGTWKYKHESQLDLPEVAEALERMTTLFTGKLGYRRELAKVSANPRSSALRTRLDRWFAAKDRHESDWIVLYYTGHGKIDEDGELYLLTSDYESEFTPSTTLAAREIGAMVVSRNASGESRRGQRFLLILDTCFSGGGVFPFAQAVRARFSAGGLGPMFYVIASSLPTEESAVGALVNALIDALEEKSLGGNHQQFIFPDELVPAINRRLPHKAQRLAIDSPDESPNFFPNIRWVPQAPLGATVEEVHRFIEQSEYLAHWNPASRGVEFATQTGDYFTGRERVMTEIGNWLRDTADPRICVVTGAPGSGKSAILSRITTSNKADFDLDLAIHAKGKTLEDFIQRIAQFLEIPPALGSVFDAVKKRIRSLHLLVDALDEAREPGLIVAKLLRPLQSIPNTKLLLGTRKELLASLGPQTLRLFVDTPEYLNRADLAQYVEARIGTSSLARTLAQAVSKKAYPNFLIARLVSDDLQSRKRLPKLKDLRLPASVAEAFQQYLERFGKDEKRARDLLAPLAWAEGGGLPWGLFWASMASAMAGEQYTNADIEWLIDNAGSFVVEALEDERSVYRLYHQALADYLRSGRPVRDVQRDIVTALMSTVPADETGRDWSSAHSYVRRHLAEHAAAAGSLPELMAAPGFLLAADSTRLLGAISASIVPLPTEIVQAYRAASIHLRSKAPPDAAPYLELAARQNGLDWKIPANIRCPWTTTWVDWFPAPPNTAIAIGLSEITALETGEWNPGQTVALVGRENGNVEVWDISTNIPLAAWNGTGSVKHVALVNAEQGQLVVAVRDDSVLYVHDLSGTQTRFVDTRGGEEDSITALVIAYYNGEWICATAHYNLRLALWKLPALTLKKERKKATGGSIYALAVVNSAGRQVLMSGGDSQKPYVNQADNSVLRLWSLDQLRLLWSDKRGVDTGYVQRIESVRFRDRNLAVVTGILRGEVWDLDSREILYDQPEWSGRWSLYSHVDETLLLAQGTVWKVELSEGRMLTHQTLRGFHVDGAMRTGITQSQGRDVVLNSRGNHVRIWDIEELFRGQSLPWSELKSFHCLALIPGRAVCVGAGDEVVLKHPASGTEIARLTVPKDGNNDDLPKSIVYCEDLDSLIIGTYRGKILRVDASRPTGFTQLIDTHEEIDKIRLVEWQGRIVVIATLASELAWKTRVWDLKTGEELFSDRHFRLSGGQQGKKLYGLAVTKPADDVRFAFAGQYGKLMVAGFEPKASRMLNFEEWRVPFDHRDTAYTRSLATGRENITELLAAGTEHGDLALWDFESGEVLAKKVQAHHGHIDALAIREGSSGTLILSGGDDGFVRLWNTSLEKLAEIELSEPVHAAIWIGERRIAAATSRGVVALEFLGLGVT